MNFSAKEPRKKSVRVEPFDVAQESLVETQDAWIPGRFVKLRTGFDRLSPNGKVIDQRRPDAAGFLPVRE